MVQKSVLGNGIRVITEKIPSAHSVTIGFWVENGSRHENVADNGISHFLEHMLFKGTESRSSADIAKEIDSVGGVLNGFTSCEYSCYYAKVLARKLPLAIDLISDIVLNSVFNLDEIEKERRVILQEIYMLEDTPDDYIHDLFSQNFWQGHPVGLPILGNRETVGGISRGGLFDLLKRRYCGENILICAAGNLEHQEIADRIGEVFMKVVPGEKNESFAVPQYHHRINILEKDLEQVHICLGTRALPQNHPNRFESYLLNAILGGGMSSRLFQKVREELGLAYSIYSYLSSHSDTGALVLYSGTSPESAPQVTAIMLKELGRLKKEMVSDEELSSAREQVKGSLLLSMESTDNRMTRLAKNEIYMGRQVSLKEVLRGLDQVVREQVRQLADYTLQDENLNLQMIGKVRESDFPLIDLTLG
jgi:predicted Zn-dependent peptidase